MRRRISILIALTTLTLVPGTGSAGAQACTSALELPEAIERANVVFVGRAVAVSDQSRSATMQVQAVWKGDDLPEQVEVNGNLTTGAAEPRIFQQGASYLVFPTNRTPPFNDHKCTATRIFNANGLLIPVNLTDAVGAASARPPVAASAAGAEEGGSGGIPSSLGVVMVLIGLLILVIFGYQQFAGGRRRSRTDMIGSEPGMGAPGVQRGKMVKKSSPLARAKDAILKSSDERRFKRARKRARR